MHIIVIKATSEEVMLMYTLCGNSTLDQRWCREKSGKRNLRTNTKSISQHLWWKKVTGTTDISGFQQNNAHGIGNFYLIDLEQLQIGVRIGKFSIVDSEELQIGTFSGTDPLGGKISASAKKSK